MAHPLFHLIPRGLHGPDLCSGCDQKLQRWQMEATVQETRAHPGVET